MVVGFGFDVGVLWVCGIKKGLVMMIDGNGCFVYFNLEVGGKMVLVEVVVNIVVIGVLLLVIIDCLNYGDFNDLEIFWEFY